MVSIQENMTNIDVFFRQGFPLGSPLVSDVSQAVLNVTQGPKMAMIEESLSLQTECPDSSTSLSSTALSLDSFWGLFLIAGVVAIIALTIFAFTFLKKNWNEVARSGSTNSMCQKLVVLWRQFIQKDLSSNTIRKGGFRGSRIIAVDNCNDIEMGTVEASPRPDSPPSPSSSSNHAEFVPSAVTNSDNGSMQQTQQFEQESDKNKT